ncbi:MAG: hypothetical protein A2V66_11320 [Ignavibacteria bacterium RBG_13_36_8]|nr:MAG: hypothetical protein A2V66_11320 [Ignavibacteria bacterium RBG_13_36_8]
MFSLFYIYQSEMETTIQSILFFIGVLLLFSCAPSQNSIYKSDYPMSLEIVRSSNTSLSLRIPEGWLSVEENLKHSIDLWLFSEDYTMSITVNPIHIDSLTALEVKRNGGNDLTAVLNYSKAFRKAFLGFNYKEVEEDEYFTINSIACAAYQYFDENEFSVRVVLFRYGNFYYEVVAGFEKPDKGVGSKAESLFKIQNSVLSSLK